MQDRKVQGVLLGVLTSLLFMGSVFVPQAKATTQTFSYTGSYQTFTAPAGVTSITVEVWGAGGGGGGSNGGVGGAGGGGGYATGIIGVAPGQSLTVYVGGGGALGPASANLGRPPWGYPSGGGGGGYSAVVTGGGTYLVQAGGGGGGGSGSGSGYGHAGGAGGGSSGADGSTAGDYGSPGESGYGGSNSTGGGAGGPDGATAGGLNYGGTGTGPGNAYAAGGYCGGGYGSVTGSNYGSGGGGGSGHYGGGGGGDGSSGWNAGGGGGGGTSYFDSSVTSQTTTGGSGTTPGHNWGNYPGGGVGVGGSGGPASGDGTAGNPGYVVITYTAATAVKLMSLSARQSPEGVLIEWRTSYEVRNLGFHVYRGQTRLTKEPLVGSALFAGQHTVLRAGNTYSWFDPGHAQGPYWVEDIDLSGTRTMHGPIVPVPAQGPLPRKTALFLSHLSRQATLAPFPFKIWRTLFGGPDFPGATPTPEETQWTLAQSAAMKLLVRQEGWYRITASQLAQAGFHIKQPRFLQLYVDGEEQPLLVTPTGIEFYATGVDTQWTDTRTYWLVNGSAPGKRIEQTGGGSGGSGALSFPFTIAQKQRLFYVSALLNGDTQNFFGTAITQEPASVAFTVVHKASGDGVLELFLQGLTDQAHQITVTLNGSSLGSVAMDGMK